LDECKSKSEALVEEIKTFKQSRVLHQQATEALESTAAALQKTLKEVQPLTEKHVRRLFYVIVSTTLLNTLFFVVVLVLMIIKN